MKNKIITAFLSIFFIIVVLNLNNVFGIGVIGQSWKQTSDGQYNLIFRLFTAPHDSTVKSYHEKSSTDYVENGAWKYVGPDGKKYTSKWISATNTGYSTPSWYTFKTIGFAFHTEQMGDYSSKSSPYIGYNSSTKEIGSAISSIKDTYQNSTTKYTTPKIAQGYNDVTFFELMRSTGTYTTVDWGTGLTISNIKHANYVEYRYAIIEIDGHNVIINDYIIYEDNLESLIKAAKEVESEASCYISNIVTSKAYTAEGDSRAGQIEVARTVKGFFSQYNMGYSMWGSSTRGRVDNDSMKALGAVANLYDNKLKFPNMAKRSVMVRHINVGKNTTISTEIIDNASIIKSNNLTISATNPDETINGEFYTGTTYPKYKDSEYYKNKLEMEQGVSKSSLADTTTYKCIGHNVEVASSWGTAMDNIATKVKNGKFQKQTSVSVPGKDIMDDADYIVIDFYYTEYEKEVEVNHIYLDKNGYVRDTDKQTIVPNETAEEGTNTIDRINTNKYISEVYVKRMGRDITVRKADSLASNENVTYIGNEKLTTSTELKDIVGKQKTKQDVSKETTAKISGDTVQVNFYYQIENIVESPEPEKTIEGSVFVTGKDSNTTTTCNDQEQLELQKAVTSIPSGNTAVVGVQGIPKYMVAAITTKYVSPVEGVYTTDLSTTFTLGNKTKKVDFEDVTYRVGYYKVTDMAVFKLDKTTIHDAGESGTVGSSLFEWNDKQVNPTNMDLKVILTGINGKTIANTSKAINNVNNYVAIKFQDSEGKEFQKTRTYLTADQLAEVDSNGDEKINNTDKTHAKEKLDELNNILKAKQKEQENKQKAYDNALDAKKNLKAAYETAVKELARLKEVYEEANKSKVEKWNAINGLQGEINVLRDTTLVNLGKELQELQNNETRLKQSKEQAESNLEAAEQTQQQLHDEYLLEVSNRNQLAAKANCNDVLDEEVYIYVDIYKEQIEAAEQCKLAKQNYNKNIKEQIVEKAFEKYEQYTQNELANAQKEVEETTKEYDEAIIAREIKESDIALKNLELTGKEKTLETLNREYEKYIKETYTPAKNAYESYRDNDEPLAEKRYNDYVEGKYIETAEEELGKAKEDTQKAQANYDKQDKYRNNLLAKYDEYKALYDEFVKIDEDDPASVADLLGLNLNIFVQNMTVKIQTKNSKGTTVTETLTQASDNTAVKTYKVSELLKNKDNITYQVTTERPVIDKAVYSKIGSTVLAPKDYNNSSKVLEETTNGVRALAGKVEYKAQVVIGEKDVDKMKDTIYYSDQSDDDKTVVFNLKTTSLEKTYKVKSSASNDEAKYEQTEPVNIYTPITVSATLKSKDSQIVNQIKEQNMEDSVIQLNTPFTITLGNEGTPKKYNKMTNTDKYNGGYYVKFDFDVHNVKINGKKYNSGNRVAAGTWIGLITENGDKDATITAQAYGNLESDEQGVISEENSSYHVRAVAYNATDIIKNKSLKYKTLSEMSNGDLKNTVKNLCDSVSYFAQISKNVIIVNRAYDFRVTDIKDVNWKNVFRSNTSGNTNQHKEIVYHSGIKKWDTTSSKSNEIINRISAEIGRNPLRILPIGPYKNTDSTYTKAPKIGYRFSFDMKVTGSYYSGKGEVNTEKKVDISTKFYYISKDGKTYISEAEEGKQGIYLFYKTSSGKYVRIGEDNSDGYELRFTPNDGYRLIQNSNKSTLATTSVKLGGLRNLTLTHNMATVSNNGAIITYYGEYKLPNSTIAVEVDKDGNYDINKPLTNGYIGVVFDISAYSGKMTLNNKTTDVVLSYSKDTNGDNTSQWDYEGYLGFSKAGSLVQDSNPLTLKLEKGTWKINNEVYNEIKGTVMLYDIDQRAATDYE